MQAPVHNYPRVVWGQMGPSGSGKTTLLGENIAPLSVPWYIRLLADMSTLRRKIFSSLLNGRLCNKWMGNGTCPGSRFVNTRL